MFRRARWPTVAIPFIAMACGRVLILEDEGAGLDASVADSAAADHETTDAPDAAAPRDAGLDAETKADAAGDAAIPPEPCDPGKGCKGGICYATGTCGPPKGNGTTCAASYECQTGCCCALGCNTPGILCGAECRTP